MNSNRVSYVERRRAAERRRFDDGRGAVRDAARHGRPLPQHACGARPCRSAPAGDRRSRAGVEHLRVAGVRPAEGGSRRPSAVAVRHRLLGARPSACSGRAFGVAGRTTTRGRADETGRPGRRVRRQRDRGLPAPAKCVERRDGSVGAGHAPAHLHVHHSDCAAGRPHTRPAGIATRALGRRARDLRGVGAASQPVPPGRRGLADRADGSSRVAAARDRHPVSGLSVRPRRPVPEARAVAAGDRRRRIRGSRGVRRGRACLRPDGPSQSDAGRRAGHVLRGNGADVSVAAQRRDMVRRHSRLATARLWVVAGRRRAYGAGPR